MAFDTREGQGKLRVGEFFDGFVIKEKFRSTALPYAPGACRFHSYLLVIAGQPPMVSADHIATFRFRNNFEILFPHVWKDRVRAFLIEPLNLFSPAEKNSAQDQFAHTVRVRLGVRQRERAAP